MMQHQPFIRTADKAAGRSRLKPVCFSELLLEVLWLPKDLGVTLSVAICLSAPTLAQTPNSDDQITGTESLQVVGRLETTASARQSSQNSINSPKWDFPQPADSTNGPVWELVPSTQASASPIWQPVTETELLTDRPAAEIQPSDSKTEPDSQPASNPWIFGLGGGLRIGVGEPNYGMAYGRIGKTITPEIAISLRPAYVFGNVDFVTNEANNEGSFVLPLTLDLSPEDTLSPFIGFGIAHNTGSNGATDPMATIGFDLNINKHMTFGAGINYIFEAADEDNRDVEAYTVLYFRF